MAKEVTLDDLVRTSGNNTKPAVRAEKTNTVDTKPAVVPSSDIKTAKPISTSDLGKNLQIQHPEAQKKIIEEDAPLVANAFKAMDDTLNEKMRFVSEEMMPVVIENAKEMAMEKEFGITEEESESVESYNDIIDDLNESDDYDDIEEFRDSETENEDKGVYAVPNNIPVIEPEKTENKTEVKKNKTNKKEKEEEQEDNSLDDMIKDLGLDEEEEDIIDTEEETAEELRERFKASLSGIKVTRDPIDLSKFQIAKEPMSSAMILNTIGTTNKKRCDHPLLHSRRNMTFEECSGPELDALRKTIDNSNGVNGVIASLRFVYNHNIDANKKSFEAWCKSIRTEDIESLYFGMYKACYGDTNLIARSDSEDKGCNKTSLINTPIGDMIKFKDDEAHKLYDNLMIQDTTNPGAKVKSQTMVISDDFVISYTDPTLYSTFIQYASLKPEIVNKYSDHLNTMAYIDGFFRIDYNNNQLIPIAIKEYPNNINKTVMSKLKAYVDILKTLSNDQYNIMVAKLDNVIGEPKISYIYPETKCPECDNTISEEPVDSMLSLLFTRAQLVQVKSL